MKLIKKLQECSTLGQADPILTKLNAGPAVKKLVETAIILSNSQDPQQRSHAYSFMESAIKELEDDDEHKEREEEMGMHSNEDKLNNKKMNEEEEKDDENKERETNDDHKIHEEELKNYNQGERTTGSEQSSDNTEPYPGEGKDTTTGEKPMQDMDGTINQWNETGIVPPGTGGPQMGAPGTGGPQMGAPGMAGQSMGAPGIMPGLAPDVAQEMGMILPELPPMDTSQMMKQMQYTVNTVVSNLYKKEIAPLHRIIKYQKETFGKQLKNHKDAIKTLSQEIQETKAASGNMKLDLDYMRQNASAKFRETEPSLQGYASFDKNGLPGIQPINRQQVKLESARSEIDQMDRILNSKHKTMYQ